MKKYDSHIHIGNYEEVLNILSNSPYRFKYKLYSCINPNVVKDTKAYIKNLDSFFAFPLFFKESNVSACNKYVSNFCLENNNAIPVLLVDDNVNFSDEYNIAIFKEHFLLHDYEKIKERDLYYSFLNENFGYLILHSKDNIRIEYIKKLLMLYKNINIIIAHLGRNTYEDLFFIDNILEEFKNIERVLFDISTIANFQNINNAIEKVGNKRILYGTDFPFEFKNIDDVLKRREIIMNGLASSDAEYIFEKNYERAKEKSYVKK